MVGTQQRLVSDFHRIGDHQRAPNRGDLRTLFRLVRPIQNILVTLLHGQADE
ncbi:MAG: hypothetical protein ACI8PT_003670 [Gammaproteobacteria bacterium]|jgi:hypothetical protein